MTHKQVKNQGQGSVGSKDRMKTDGRTETTDRIIFVANAVCNDK